MVVNPGRWDRTAWDLRAGRRGPGTADWSPASREFSAAWGRGAELPGLRSLRSGRAQRTLRAGAWRGQDPRVLQRLRGPGDPTAQRKRRDYGERNLEQECLKGSLSRARACVPSACAASMQWAQVPSRACSLRPRDGKSLLKCWLGDTGFDLKQLLLWRICRLRTFILTL